MKPTICTLASLLAVTLTASATPSILLETIISEEHAPAQPEIISRPTVLAISGEKAIIQTGSIEYVMIATLLEAGSIDIRTVLTDKATGKKLAITHIDTQLGKVAELQVGQWIFQTKATLGK